ncbi:MAG: hypothetical protein PHH90_08645 [Limnochordia bacterium]|nr:hypothetical protein [Limnochordia bacterium]
MEIPITDPKKWCKIARRLSGEERHAFIRDTFAQELPQEFKEGIDVGWFLDDLGWLEDQGRYEEVLDFASLVYEINADMLEDSFYYVDAHVIDIKLFQGRCSSEDLVRLFANPVDSIDHLIPIFDKLVFYGHLDMMMDVIEHCYEKVKNDDKLVGRAESDFGEAAFMLKFQQVYEQTKAGQAVDTEEIVAYLGSYDYKFTSEEVEDIIAQLCTELADTGFAVDEVVTQEDILCLSMVFPKYLYAQTGLNFQIGSILWYAVMDMCPLADSIAEESSTFGELFAADSEAFQAYIYDRLDLISNKKPHAVGVLWGLPYFYDFLLTHELISEELHTRILKMVEGMKSEVIKFRVDELWKYDYVHVWPAPKSVNPARFAREAQLFGRTFSEHIDVDELVEVGFIPTKER